jgi:hypothetical protein
VNTNNFVTFRRKRRRRRRRRKRKRFVAPRVDQMR